MTTRTEKEVAMVSSVSEVLRLRKEKGAMTPEEMMREFSRFMRYTRDEKVKVLMVASASKALELMTKFPGMKDKEVMGEMVKSFDDILVNVDGEMK